MKAKLIIYAEPLLKILALRDDLKIEQLPDIMKISEEDICEIIEYLKEKDAVVYLEVLGTGFSSFVGLEVTSKGAEVALNKRKLIETQESNFQQMNINAPVQNAQQSQGDNNSITQIIDNSKYMVLKEMIEQDTELDEPKKKTLFDLLEKFNTLKTSGENALELIKKVSSIGIKYVPLFFSLLS